MSLLTHFRSEPLPVGQICQSKGRGRINIISVESGPNVSPLLLSCLSHLGQERLFCLWNGSRHGPSGVARSCDHTHVLGYSGGISLVCGLLLEEHVCLFTIRDSWNNKTVLIPFQDCKQLPDDWTKGKHFFALHMISKHTPYIM